MDSFLANRKSVKYAYVSLVAIVKLERSIKQLQLVLSGIDIKPSLYENLVAGTAVKVL